MISLFAALALAAAQPAVPDAARALCEAAAGSLAAPLSEPAGIRYAAFWGHFLRDPAPYPFKPETTVAAARANCADPGSRSSDWMFLQGVLQSSGRAAEALRLAEERVRVEPSDGAWSALAVARLRQGDEAGALAAWRSQRQAGESDPRAVAEITSQLIYQMNGAPDRKPSLAYAQANVRRWRSIVEAGDGLGDRDSFELLSALKIEGDLLELSGDARSAADRFGEAASLSEARLAQAPDDFSRRDRKAGLMRLYVARSHAQAAAGDRDGVIDTSRKAAVLVDGERFLSPNATVLDQIANGLWSGDVSIAPVAEAFGGFGRDLLKVGAPREAVGFLRVSDALWKAHAKADGRASDGASEVLLARALRLSGDAPAALATIDRGLALAEKAGIEGNNWFWTGAGLERGEALLAMGLASQACAAFRRARPAVIHSMPEPHIAEILATLDARLAGPPCAPPVT
ncbi:hypothetical protein CFHF_15965 [Caulobacter flavus]|nr:hypothetical protein [Caulobacter flavus]PLR11522.1 hypothetical protein CFHF_15965 [Caulobacter flavus]